MKINHMYDKNEILVVEKKTTDVSHKKTRSTLIDFLNALNITYDIVTFDDIRHKKTDYFDPKEKKVGIITKHKFVIALGGDGTLLHTSHYVGGDVRLLGINSAPKTSKGYLCALKPEDIQNKLQTILFNHKLSKNVKRLQIDSSTTSGLLEQGSFGHKIPLCLNDVLVCHSHPAATTRTQLSLWNRAKKQVEFSENIYSSGVWVSTVSGKTAAISSYGFAAADIESDVVFVAIREPFLHINEKEYPHMFSFSNAEKTLSICSKMSSGLICVDGHESCALFEIGDTIEFSTPDKAVLKLIL